MLNKLVPYHLIHFQKLKHVVTRYFDTKLSEKSKQKQRQPGPFIQIQILFFNKNKNLVEVKFVWQISRPPLRMVRVWTGLLATE